MSQLRHIPRPPGSSKSLRTALTFIAAALALNALAGERGLLDLLRARGQERTLTASIAAARAENARLRNEVLRLKEDPAMIEAIARRELGLLRRGEILVVVRR